MPYEDLCAMGRQSFCGFHVWSLCGVERGRYHTLDVRTQKRDTVSSPVLALVNPSLEISSSPILFKCRMPARPPKLSRHFDVILNLTTPNEPCGSGSNHAIVSAGGDSHLCRGWAH